MVSLVNFKLMPEDNNKSHDQELALSSSLSMSVNSTNNNNHNNNKNTNEISPPHIVANNNYSTSSGQSNNRNNSNNSDTNHNNHHELSNNKRHTNKATTIVCNNNHKPPTPPKPHKLSTTNVDDSVVNLTSSIQDNHHSMHLSNETTISSDHSNGSIGNGYSKNHHVIVSPARNHSTNNNNHQKASDLVQQQQQQQQSSQQQQHFGTSSNGSSDEFIMMNVNKSSSSSSHPVASRHQRQASISGNIHQAYCVKVSSANINISTNVVDNNNQHLSNHIKGMLLQPKDNMSSQQQQQQQQQQATTNHQQNYDNNSDSASNYHQLDTTAKPINTQQQHLVVPINNKDEDGHQHQHQQYYEQDQHQQHKQTIVLDACKSSQKQISTLTIKESPQIDANSNCLNGAAEPDKAKYLLGDGDKLERFFTVTWRDLSFVIRPKWHNYSSSSNKKSDSLQNGSNTGNNTALVNLPSVDSDGNLERNNYNNSSSSSSSNNSNNNTTSSASILKSNLLIKNLKQTKVVLDSLDGCFKSGELTAILGPSGAGKTTLLDCLTGHRKKGLSGSIKIRSSSTKSSSNNDDLCCYNNGKFISLDQKHLQDQQKLPTSDAPIQRRNNNNNLKVSIIPQNDHLIGHLTVYETLSYASKMKNCFDRKFDHKSNIERVSQQLGLLSCLSTRINKLSGGQYKRVSIAQELLSNPDILILDEPTSGLDAMTCYQTVQVLRRLADNRQLTNNQIAIILTIHQPNSDVFQQFNHVYVVAQGGKSIYEGPPSGIVSVIQKIGLNMPSVNYNPATMIVEIAAGKFGYDSIAKLNKIQKKQYNRNSYYIHSAGDDMDCFGSEQSENSSGDEGNKGGTNVEGEKKKGKKKDRKKERKNKIRKFNQDDNNNIESDDIKGLSADNHGIVNKAFQPDYEKDHNVLSNVVIVDPAQLHTSSVVGQGGGQDPHRGGGGDDHNGKGNKKRNFRRANRTSENGGKRLKLNSLKADQKFPFWRHTYLHFHRSWLSIVRDPMLCGMQLFLHIIIPIMVSMVYGPNVGQPNACPRAGPMDLITFALEPEDSTLNLQEELRVTLENIGYIFFKLYGIIFAAMTVTVLTFPLDMHVLVKEFRNGWYGLSSYFLGRTLADIPFQLTLPFLAMSLSYYATGQPYSYLQWRFMSITAILILSSLIAQSQGLLFGAILMDKMKAAVFVAPAATTPIILFAGFLVRTQSIPYYLRPLSNLSYLRYAIEACLISRYGFNQCECDPAIFNQTVPELPPIARTMLDYWLSSFKAEQQQNNNNLPSLASSNSTDLTSDNNSTSLSLFNNNNSTSFLSNNTSNGTIVYSNLTAITTTSSPIHPTDDYVGGVAAAVSSNNQPDLFTKLIDSLAKANSFGRNITSCDQVLPYPMIDYNLKDSQLFDCFAVLLFMLIFTRFLTFFIVSYKVKRKV